MEEIRWSRGPHELRLGEKSVLPLPEGVVFAEGAEMHRFLVATGNALTGKELAVFGAADLSWFVVVSTANAAGPGELAWMEESRESDDREVVIQSILRGATLFELVSEKATSLSAQRTVEPILAGLHDVPPTRSSWWLLLLIPFLLIFWIRRRPPRSKS